MKVHERFFATGLPGIAIRVCVRKTCVSKTSLVKSAIAVNDYPTFPSKPTLSSRQRQSLGVPSKRSDDQPRPIGPHDLLSFENARRGENRSAARLPLIWIYVRVRVDTSLGFYGVISKKSLAVSARETVINSSRTPTACLQNLHFRKGVYERLAIFVANRTSRTVNVKILIEDLADDTNFTDRFTPIHPSLVVRVSARRSRRGESCSPYSD